MSRLILLGATGSLGRHVLHQALAAGHEVTVFVRTPSRVSVEARARVAIHSGDLSLVAPADLARVISGQDALINCAGRVTDGQTFVDIIARLVTAVESLPPAEQPVCWFLAGAALLDIDESGRKAVQLRRVKSTYWPHWVNFERIRRSPLDWRLLCSGPMVEEPALGRNRLRITLDRLPVRVPAFAGTLLGPLILPIFAYLIPQMIVPYADAAALMLANLDPGNTMARHRVGLALPIGMRGKKSRMVARPTDAG